MNIKIDEIEEIIKKTEEENGGLIGILYKIQDRYNFISDDIQVIIAEKIGIPKEKIENMIEFYSCFSKTPKGKYHINVCSGVSCLRKRGENLLIALEKELDIKDGEVTEDGIFSLSTVRCFGACGLAPVMRIGKDIYGNVDSKKIKDILQKYKNECIKEK